MSTQIPHLGAWHLVPKPRAFRHGDITYIGWFRSDDGDEDGVVGISAYDHKSNRLKSHVFQRYEWVDDHTAPAVLRRPDGHLVVVWNPRKASELIHSQSLVYTISEHPDPDLSQIGEWETPYNTIIADIDDYVQAVMWDGNVRFYYRVNDDSGEKDIWSYVESTDGGQTFGQRQEWIDFSSYRSTHQDNDRPELHRIYPTIKKEHRDGDDRLHVAFGGYRQVNQDKIRHFYLENGEYYDSHGNAIGVSDGTAITSMSDPTAFGMSHWTTDHWTDSPKLMDLQVSDGEVHVAFEDVREVGSEGADGDYRAGWAKYDSGSSEWVVGSEITDMGTMVPESAPSPGGYHKGGVRMDPEDPTTVFTTVLTSQEDRSYQVKEFATDDDGERWQHVKDLSDDGVAKNFEETGDAKRGGVIGVRNHDGEELRVLWWEGRHDRLIDYDIRAATEDALGENAVTQNGQPLTVGGTVIDKKW